MNSREIEQLVHETVELTSAPPPPLLDANSPAYREEAMDGEMYLVGLIGGKDVGKSALVNALVGKTITASTDHGPGTRTVIAYAHSDRKAELAKLLDEQTPGNYSIVTHGQSELRNQVLLDLPDIDSRFADHVQITRKMLRHMLFPVWIQSVEKYADAQPQNLLAQVAAGNDPKNFLFCLNKVDQLVQKEKTAADTLRTDYAGRIAKVLSLAEPPRILLISAIQPEGWDLPALAKLLSRQKSSGDLADSLHLAQRRRQRSMVNWLVAQDLPARAARLLRLEEEASELLSERIGVPLVEEAVPAILDDAAYRAVMTEGLFDRRVARWPVVNILQAALSPLMVIVRENTAAGSGFGGPEALVDGHLSDLKPDVAARIQSAFAQLHQTNAIVGDLYGRRKLWESMDGQAAAGALRAQMIETVHRQRQAVLEKLSGAEGCLSPIVRIGLTIGAILWFPIVQPILQIVLTSGSPIRSLHDGVLLFIDVMSTEVLLKNAVFLLLWHLFLWAVLRWDTRRRVDRLLEQWQSAKHPDPGMNLTTVALSWMDDLLKEIRSVRETTQSLAEKIQSMQDELGAT
jgi:GTPase Era involved in 16S rRNA processing